jgi:hypothetical protein
MSEAAENQELGWTPAKFEDDLDGLDRGDSVGLGETEEAQAAVAEEAEAEVSSEVEEVEDTDEVETPVDEEAETGEELEVADTDESDDADDEGEEPAAVEDDKKKPHMIPKDRLDQELAKRRQLENKLKELEAKVNQETQPQNVDFDFDEAETKYMEAVMDGETEKAKRIRAEIRTMERQQMQIELQNSMQQTSQQTQAQIRLESAVKEITTAYPYLDLNSPEADQDLINETNELMTGFLNAGYDAVDALNKAVSYTTKSASINAAVDEPAVIPNAVDKKVVADKAAKKTADSAAKKAQAAKQQPPKLSGESSRSRDSNVVDIFQMSDKELNQLSEEQLRKLRGDFG